MFVDSSAHETTTSPFRNANLRRAQENKRDEFYTRYEDIENEVQHYWKHLRDKVVYCNCDDPNKSNFVRYFVDNFHNIGLRNLVATCYRNDLSPVALKMKYDGSTKIIQPLKGDGSFESAECMEILEAADVVITNPPFSLFRAFFDTLFEHDKDMLLLGHLSATTYKNVFPHIKSRELQLGVNKKAKKFWDAYNETYKQFGNIHWYTTLDHGKQVPPIKLTKTYRGNEHLYPKYDNYDAVEVARIKDIPMDYDGIMGVPITFIEKHNPQQFRILEITKWADSLWDPKSSSKDAMVDGKKKYNRLFIQRTS